jgi:hypothetical protein
MVGGSAPVAQGIEHRSPKAGVARSNRAGGTVIAAHEALHNRLATVAGMSRDGLRLLWLKVIARPAVLVVFVWLWWPGDRLLHSWISQLSLLVAIVAAVFWIRLFLADLRALIGAYRDRRPSGPRDPQGDGEP